MGYGVILGQQTGVRSVNKVFPDETGNVNLDTWNLNKNYPVGSIYMSVSATSPAQLFGGSWNKIEDTFLLASGTKYTAGSRGGEAEHKLTTEEMARHFHRVYGGWVDGDAAGTDSLSYHRHRDAAVMTGAQTWDNEGNFVEKVGGDKPHNNMPPYLAVNVWQRIS